jgi:hypothetical protein
MTATDPDTGTAAVPDSGIQTYLQVARIPAMRAWLAAVLCQRLPIAMTPLALVYVGRAVAGSYSAGALLAGVFAFAEAAAAAAMGRRFDRRPAGLELGLVLAIQAVALLVVGVPATVSSGALPVWALVLATAVAGAVASGAHGGLRALLLRTVPGSAQQAALSLEASLTTLVWAVGPAIVAGVAVLAGPSWPILVSAALAGLGVLVARWLRDPGPVAVHAEAVAGLWRTAWPALLHEGAVLMCVGAAYTALAPLLVTVGVSANIAGPALAAFAVAGIIGGLVYGARIWPGPYRTQTVVLVLAVCAAVTAAAVAPTAGLVIGLLVLSGLAGTPALTARAAALQQLLPESSWAAGFSGLYAAGGVGFGLAGLLVAPLLDWSGARTALVVCTMIAAAAAVVGGLAEARRARATGGPAGTASSTAGTASSTAGTASSTAGTASSAAGTASTTAGADRAGLPVPASGVAQA